MSVLVADAKSGSLPFILESLGTVQPIATVAVRSRVDSLIEKILVADGSEVKAGDVLVELDSRQIRAQIAAAEATLAKDKASLEQAQRDVRRYGELLARDTGTRVNYDNARTQVATLMAQISADQAQVDNLKVQLSYYTITAPITGRIGAFSSKAGNLIRAADATATGVLVTIVQSKPIYVVFSAPQRHLADLREALAGGENAVEAFPQGGGKSARGKLAILDNVIDPTTGSIAVRAVFENADDALWAGQLCNLRVTLRTDQNVVTIPREATQSGQSGNFVYVVADGVAKVQPVTIGRTQDGRDVVLKGLKGDEKVVIDGALSLINGSRVQIRNEPPKRAS